MRLKWEAYSGDDAPLVPDAPFTPVAEEVSRLTLALVTAGGVRIGEDPMGADGPTQQEVLLLIKEFLRSDPTVSVIPEAAPDDQLTARHPRLRRTYRSKRPWHRLPCLAATGAGGRG